MALGLTQPLTEMSTRSISRGKGGQCVRLTTYRHPVPLSWNLGTLNSWKPLGHSGSVMGLLYLYYVPACTLCVWMTLVMKGYEIQPSLLLIGWRKRARICFAGMYLRQVYQLHHPLSPQTFNWHDFRLLTLYFDELYTLLIISVWRFTFCVNFVGNKQY